MQCTSSRYKLADEGEEKEGEVELIENEKSDDISVGNKNRQNL